VSAPSLTDNRAVLVFDWDTAQRRRRSIAGFILASLLLHALGFYIFQIIYPPTVALLPPPARVNVIAPRSDDERVLLRWLEAEDPALASTTQPPTVRKLLSLPVIQHAPSYLSRRPELKNLPPLTQELTVPSARPPAAVERPRVQSLTAAATTPTVVVWSADFYSLGAVQSPPVKFAAAQREAAQRAQFQVAADENGEVRYCFLERSSGDTALDAQARQYLALSRFSAIRHPPSTIRHSLTWGTATIEWGNDIALPPAPRNKNAAP